VVTRVFDRVAPADLFALTKPRIALLVVLTVAAGFVLAMPLSSGTWTMSSWLLLLHTLFGAAMVAAGTNALNQVMERDVDALMRRTSRRPLPSGRLGVRDATVFAWGLGVVGVGYLALFVNVTTACVAAATLLSYVLLYTPLKRRTPVSTLIGVIPGALPIAVDRSANGKVVGWDYTGGPGVGAGGNSTLLVIHTDATQFVPSTNSVINGSVATVPSYGPLPIPEPASMGLAGVALLGLVARRRSN